MFDTSPGSTVYTYCTAYCPTGFAPGLAPICTKPADDKREILSYDFNIPSETFANVGEGGAITATATIVSAAGNPAKNRGIYFDGASDGFVRLGEFTLHHTFAVHAWVLAKSVAAEMTVLSKDRAFPSAGVRNFLDLVVATKKIEARLSTDIAPYT
jgi:hypothetical protein